MNDVWASFIDLTDQTCEHMQLIRETEREKRLALLEYNEKNMEAVLQKLQAMIMKLESLERSRFETLQTLQLEKFTGEELLNYVPVEYKGRFQEKLQEMRKVAMDIKELNQLSQKIAKTELGLLGGEVSQTVKTKSGVYGNTFSGKTAERGHSAFQKKL